MAPHMAASLAPSMTLPPSLSLTLLHPLIAPQGSHQPLLPLLSLSLSFCFCLSACLPASLYLSLFPSIVFLSLSCSKAAAPHSGLRGYDKERPQIHARAHSCTPTQTDISHIVTALSGFSKPLLKKSDCFSTLNSSYLVPHNCWIICLSNKKK